MKTYTLSELRQKVRSLLNEPAEGFWSNDQIDSYINSAIRKYAHSTFRSGNIAVHVSYSVTYPANEKYLDAPDIPELIIIDALSYTDGDRNIYIRKAESLEDIIRIQSAGGLDGGEYCYWSHLAFNTEDEDVVRLRLWIAPVPNKALELRIDFWGYPDSEIDEEDELMCNSLMAECIVLEAAKFARIQEENASGVALLEQMQARYEDELIKVTARGSTGGPKRITYRPVD